MNKEEILEFASDIIEQLQDIADGATVPENSIEAEKLLNELNTWVIYDLEDLVTALKALEKDE